MSFQDLERGGGGPRAPAGSTGRLGGIRELDDPSQAVAAGIFQINTAVASFKRLVDAIGTVKDTPDHRLKLHKTRQRIGQLVKETSSKLKALTNEDHVSDVPVNRKIEHAKLARDFQAILKDYQNAQQTAADREASYTPSMPSASTSSAIDESSSGVTRAESRPFLMEQKRQELVLLDNEISFNEAIIEEREQGIKDIQSQIGEVNEIFKDLAVLVHDQGVLVEDIDSNIESSHAATAHATVQLAKASKTQKSGQSWSCWLLVVFIVIVVIVVVILII